MLFELNGTRYGADLTQVSRFDLFNASASVGSPLGKPRLGRKALVIAGKGGQDWYLAIDSLFGVRTVPHEQLRRLPRVAMGGSISIGAWLDGDQAVLLVDLKAMSPA